MSKIKNNTAIDLLKGWEWKTINQIAKIKGGKRLPKGSSFTSNKTKFPYIRVTDFIDSGTINISSLRYIDEATQAQIKNYTITSEDLYISIAGTIGKTGIIPKELNGANLTENAVKLEYIDKRKIVNKYVYLFTQSRNFLEQAGLATKAVAMPKLAITRLAQIQIPLPPLTEQRRIVARLDTLFEKIDKAIALTTENIAHTRHLLPAALNEVFGEAEEKEWKMKKIDDIAFIKGGKRLPKGEKLLEEKTPYPYIRVSDFTDAGTIDASNLKYLTNKVQHQIRNYVIFSKDLYISIAGTIGKTGIIPEELDGANLTENAARLVFKDEKKIFNKFIYYFTLSSDFIEQAGLATKTVAQPKLALTRLKEVIVPVPDLPTQQRMVSYLNQLSQRQQQLLQHYEKQLQQLQGLKASLLDAAFRGEL
jgi:type I restriction enzyme S subunit